ncbi:MAG: archaetidylserine decarboxylase [Bacteroidota bacterium]
MHGITYVERSTGEQKVEHPPGEAFLRFLYHHPLGPLALQVLVKRRLLTELYGRRMHSKASKSQVRPFIHNFQIDESEFEDPIESFDSFNDFFIRKLKPEARPIGDGLVSPADGKVLAFERVADLEKFFVKGRAFDLRTFLQNEALAARHQDSTLLLIRLAPDDYHRYHFPYAGLASSPQAIGGSYFSVSPYALRPNFGRVFLENKRSYTLLDTPDRGQMVLAPVGATMVGSIVHTYEAGQPVEKGEEMGYFAFGGSSILMLIEKAQAKIHEDILDHTAQGLETTIKMGEQLGG